MITKRQYEFEDNIKRQSESYSKGVFSGFSIRCGECLYAYDICCKHKAEYMMENNQIIEEPNFSWSPCDLCQTSLGGDRHIAHGLDENYDEIHLEICTDCLMYISNGELPEDWESFPGQNQEDPDEEIEDKADRKEEKEA